MPARRQPEVPLLDVAAIRATRYGLIDISFQVAAGTRHALIIPPVAGTGLLEIIAGLEHPDDGQVYLDGRAVTGRPMAKLTRESIGHLPASPRWYAAPTVHGVLESAVRWQVLTRRRPAAGLTGPQQVAEMLRRCGLAPYAHVRADRLPPGWWRMLDLAVILLHRPRLILVDQATTGLADRITLFRHVLDDLPDTVAVLATVATVADAAGLADQLTVINEGRVISHPPVGQGGA